MFDPKAWLNDLLRHGKTEPLIIDELLISLDNPEWLWVELARRWPTITRNTWVKRCQYGCMAIWQIELELVLDPLGYLCGGFGYSHGVLYFWVVDRKRGGTNG